MPDTWHSPLSFLLQDGQRVRIRMADGTEYENMYYHAGWKNPCEWKEDGDTEC